MKPLDAPSPEDRNALRTEHRDLDTLFGRFLAACANGAPPDAAAAIARFDEALRLHLRVEETLFPPAAAGKLVAVEGESAAEILFRELRLEHVQIRELSGMIRRVLADSADLAAARALSGRLARRWDDHTRREEREWLGWDDGDVADP
jgi:hypothetical protein